MNININISTFSRMLLIIIGVLFLLHCSQLVTYFIIGDADKFDFIELLDFDYEGNLPAFYSSLALLFSSILLALISYQKKLVKAEFKTHWLLLSCIFIGLTLDEALGLHEELGDLVEDLEIFKAKGYLYFAWVVPYAILLSVFSLSYLRFTLSLPKPTRYKFLFAGLIFISGALGLEIISAKEASYNGTATILYSVLYTLEEMCEMLGIVIFIHALLEYIREEFGDINISLK